MSMIHLFVYGGTKIGTKNHEITRTLVSTTEMYSIATTLISTTSNEDLIFHLFSLSQGVRFEKGQKGEQAVVEPVSAGV